MTPSSTGLVDDDGPGRPGGSPGRSGEERQPEPGGGAASGGKSPSPAAPEPSTDHSTGFRIVVDRDLCQGHGVCEAEAPDVFEVPKRDLVVLIENPGDEHRKAVEAAVKYCPTHALSIQEDQP